MRLIDADVLFPNGVFYVNEENPMASLEELLNRIANAPTIEAESVRHGRWVMKETMIRSPIAKNAYCSECLEETAYAHNYCPNCGAKMDGEE